MDTGKVARGELDTERTLAKAGQWTLGGVVRGGLDTGKVTRGELDTERTRKAEHRVEWVDRGGLRM